MVEGDETPELSATDRKIVKQIEYYFGDMNLPRDNFLREEIKKDDGWVSLETMLKFNRLKQLSPDSNVITTALKASGTSFIEVSEDNEKIRRNPELPVPELTKERDEDLRARSIYAKGFPLDMTLDELSEFFNKFGKAEQVQMRKDAKKNFKGSVFVVFSSKEQGQSFLKEECVKYGDTELKRETRDSYFKRKQEEKKTKKEDTLKKKLELKKQQEDEDAKNLTNRMTKGAILCLKNIPTGTSREQIKETWNKYSPVAYIEFNTGETEARVRFETEGTASVALERMKQECEGKVSVNGEEVEPSILEGDAEVDHWKKIFQDQKERRDFKRRGGGFGRGGGGGRGGRGGGRGGGGGNFSRGRKRYSGDGRNDSQRKPENEKEDAVKKVDESEPPVKKQKTEVQDEPAVKKQRTEVEATS